MAKKKSEPQQANEDAVLDENRDFDRLTENGNFSEAISSIVQQNFSDVFGKRNLKPIHELMKVEGKKVNEGNLESGERMLIVQAHTLNVIFNNLAGRASRQDNLQVFEHLIRLAYKAQSQCRTTLETLASIKNPPHVAFVKQANIGHNQQVNNGIPGHSPSSCAGEIKNQQTQLLEESHVERLDIRTKSASIYPDKKLETVGKVHGTKKPRR